MKIGYIGLGALGSQLARRFLPDHSLCVWDINAAAANTLAAHGAEVAPTASELARRSDVVLLCLPRSSDVERVVFGAEGLAAGLSAGKLVIDQTSGVPETTRDIADKLAKSGIDMMDAAVSASPHVVAAGGATLMVAASDAVLERAMPALQAITPTIYRCGSRVGDGQAMKMVNNAMNAGCRLGTLEVVAAGRKAGLSLAFMSDFLGRSDARNQTTEKMLPALVQRKSSTNFALSLMLKDVTQAVSLGISQRVPMPVTGIVRGLLQIGINTLGNGAQLEDMVGLIESMAGTRLADDASQEFDRSAVRRDAEQETVALVSDAIAALSRLISFECIAAGLRYGLALDDMSQVINKSSGWSDASKAVFSELLSGTRHDGADLKKIMTRMDAACMLGDDCGAPMLIANAVRCLLEQALNHAGENARLDELAAFYDDMANVRLTPSHQTASAPARQFRPAIHY
ncbi:NAD-binding protein [Burkholderia sp. A9]|uniref:NAD-binding protein n=1 Tax=Burkholderia sp. A9 TaxID=1365108 RepID=UPI000693CFBB|nr:NAD-binding protein [Burkholderia sp. A9]